ncbi:MAG TPA: M24 family metallopeptidase, partial [archaeon]|nr:M24 family metallopeptidase [archaeon]
MEGDELKSYEKAGKVLKKALEFGEKHARPGIKIVELAEKIEAFIKDEGCFPAFPANIDVNEIAAHFTPREDFEGVLGENDLVKLDLGVHS